MLSGKIRKSGGVIRSKGNFQKSGITENGIFARLDQQQFAGHTQFFHDVIGQNVRGLYGKGRFLKEIFDGGFAHGSVLENEPDDARVRNGEPGFGLVLAAAGWIERSVDPANSVLTAICIARITQHNHHGNGRIKYNLAGKRGLSD